MSKRKPRHRCDPFGPWPRASRRVNFSRSSAPDARLISRRSSREPILTGRSGRFGLYGPGALSVVGTNGDTFDSSRPRTCPSRSTRSPSAGSITYRDPAGRHGHTQLRAAIRERLLRKPDVTPTGELGKIDIGQVSNFRTVQNGIYAIDMPDFYLAHTETTKPSIAVADSHRRPCRPARSISRRG